MYKNDLTESEYAGFYHHPTLDHVVISRDGRIVDTVNNHCPIPYMGPAGYLQVNIYGHGSHHVHRLMAETFLEKPEWLDMPVVNHKDGDKLNNDIENIEWVSYSDNSTHAYVTGLRQDNRPLVSKDLITNETTRYYSLQEAARCFGVNGSAVYRYLISDELVPWKKRYELVYEGESWRGLTHEDVGKIGNGQSRDIVVEKDGKVYVLASIADASRVFGISKFKLYAALSGKTPKMNIVVNYLEDYNDSIEEAIRLKSHKSSVVRPNFKRLPTPVNVTDLITGEKLYWQSVDAFAKTHGVGKSVIQKSIKAKAGHWRHYKIEYIGKKSSPVSETIQ